MRLPLFSFACLCVAGFASAQTAERPFVAGLFSDNMVLQRDQPDPIWGWTTPGSKVTVTMEGKSVTATADENGKWLARITPPPTGGPYSLTVDGPEKVTFSNVLVGDVWICSGQSNMEFGLKKTDNAEEEIANANHPKIRIFLLNHALAERPSTAINGTWKPCTPETVVQGGWGGFTAVGYFFGRNLQQALNIPIGLIETSWGGTIAESWTSREAIEATTHDFDNGLRLVDKAAEAKPDGEVNLKKLQADWFAENKIDGAVSTPAFNASSWKVLHGVPIRWEDAGEPEFERFDGVAWLRKEFEVPSASAGKKATLHIGPLDDGGSIWVNGVKVDESIGMAPRNIPIPDGVLKAGKNVVAVWLFDGRGHGGILGDPARLSVEVPDSPAIPLAGDWQYQIVAPIADLPPALFFVFENPNLPTHLFNAMVNPLVPYGIKGAIWYQGEANASRAFQYRTVLPTMIKDWRARWGEGDFPFLIVQLANFIDAPEEIGSSAWAELREAQALTAQNIPNVGIVTAIDIGNPRDIHPTNKQEVGRRLGLVARAQVYGEDIAHSGPVFESATRAGDAMRVKFAHAEGLHATGDKVTGFLIAGGDNVFHPATATLDGDTVLVKSPDVKLPVAVRYNWGNNPDGNLRNGANLPAFPFRSDDWPGITVNNK